MLKYILRRTAYSILILLVASVVIFSGLHIAPGSVTDALTNAWNRHYMGEHIEERLGLNKPLPVQYVIFMRNLLSGDPGLSLISGEPITSIIAEAGVKTIALGAAAALLTYLIAIPLGVIAAYKRNSIIDQGSMFLAVLGMGIPNFFLALVLIQIFAVQFRWLPVAGSDTWKNLVLPAIVLSAEAVALNLRLMRSSLLEELGRDYVRTLRAKGLAEWRILWLHCFRNALPPVIALAGVLLRTLVGYTLIVEVIFRWPGLGFQLVDSIQSRDYSLAQVLALLLTGAVVLFNLLADIGHQIADPRVRERSLS